MNQSSDGNGQGQELPTTAPSIDLPARRVNGSSTKQKEREVVSGSLGISFKSQLNQR